MPLRSSLLVCLAIVALLPSCRGSQSELTSLLLTLDTDQRTYRSGEPIDLLLKLNNRSDRDTTLEFSSGQRYDFQLADAAGETAWTWSADRSFIQALGSERLATDGALEYRERFTGQLKPGSYRLTGLITTLGSPLQASTTITVE